MIGNRIFGHALILCIAVALLLAPWGSYHPQPKDAVDAAPIAAPVSIESLASSEGPSSSEAPAVASADRLVNGLEGHVSIGQVKIAYWMIVAMLAMGALTSVFNFSGWTRLSSLLMFACFGMSAACSLVALIDFSFNGSLGAGTVLAMICSLVGIAISPEDQPQTRVVVPDVAEPARQMRRAA